jgi:Tfp pilus assembly protein PilF
MTGWMMAVTVALAPSLAEAQAVLDHPHRVLGEGVSLVVAGQYAAAIPKLTEALREDPRLGNAHYNLAVAYKHTGDLDRAIAEYQCALQLTPRRDEVTTGQVLYGLALARDANGERDAWSQYLAWARPRTREQPAVQIALERQAQLNGVVVPGTQKATR